MKGRPVEELVYEHMFPRPRSSDPQNFSGLLHRSLVPEVRQETHAFYGHLDTHEAKYPGLDYTHATHRARLSRWPWHGRLFRAFNALGLTHAEIAGLTKWEGTKWAKEKFEREQGVVIRDTTANGFPDWVEPVADDQDDDDHPRSRRRRGRGGGALSLLGLDDSDHDDRDDDDESDDELESVGVELNQRLRAQAARREAGDTSVVMDEEWEQWLKYAIETGELTVITEHTTESMFRRATSSSSVIPAALISPSMMAAARAGRWADIPDFLQPVLRRSLDAQAASRAPPPPPRAAAAAPALPAGPYPDLRLSMDASRTAESRGA